MERIPDTHGDQAMIRFYAERAAGAKGKPRKTGKTTKNLRFEFSDFATKVGLLVEG